MSIVEVQMPADRSPFSPTQPVAIDTVAPISHDLANLETAKADVAAAQARVRKIQETIAMKEALAMLQTDYGLDKYTASKVIWSIQNGASVEEVVAKLLSPAKIAALKGQLKSLEFAEGSVSETVRSFVIPNPGKPKPRDEVAIVSQQIADLQREHNISFTEAARRVWNERQ